MATGSPRQEAHADIQVVVERADGGISIITPAVRTERDLQSIIDKAMLTPKKMVGATYRMTMSNREYVLMMTPANVTMVWEFNLWIPNTKLPVLIPAPDQLRHYRDCWKWENNQVVCDPALAIKQDLRDTRRIRDRFLLASDKFMVSDRDYPPGMVTFRAAMRDITETLKSPKVVYNETFQEIVWPPFPSFT